MSKQLLPFTAKKLFDVLQSFPAANSYLVGYSGGGDSTALLHALQGISALLSKPMAAVHVNHGLHQDAAQWQTHCETFCKKHEIKLFTLNIKLESNTGKGIEAQARYLRYQAIETLLQPGDSLLTAHHADDQAETLLLNLMRGSGIDGLSAMPECRTLGQGVLQRPLLGFSHASLIQYLQLHEITWLEDPSNQLVNQDRNFLRNEIIPALEERWPGVSKRLLLTRKTMAETRLVLECVADADLERHLVHPFVLQLDEHFIRRPGLFKLLVRRWIRRSGASSIPVYRLESLISQVQQAKNTHKVCICWDGWALHLYRNKLWLLEDNSIVTQSKLLWPEDSFSADLGEGLGRLELTGAAQIRPAGEFEINSRKTCKQKTIQQDKHHKKLKDLFQTAGIPSWLRDSIPLCSLGGELVALGDWCFSTNFSTWMKDQEVNLEWRPHHPLLQFIRTCQHLPVVDPADVVR